MTEQAAFSAVERVVADDLRFRLRLGIGEDAYRAIRVGKTLQRLWDIGGVAATGAAAAKSSVVAATFFGGGGILGLIGLGTAATPLGWVVAAGVVSAGAYWGVLRLIGTYGGARVHKIPAFLNSPVDWLGASLVDMIGTLAVKLAEGEGGLAPADRARIAAHFVTGWGIDALYAQSAIDLIAAHSGQIGVTQAAQTLGRFLRDNDDCNPEAIRADIMALLREGIGDDPAPGVKAALAEVEAVLAAQTAPFLRRKVAALGHGIADGAAAVAGGLSQAGQRLRRKRKGKGEGEGKKG